LVTEFADRTKLPQLFFTGARLATRQDELRRFAAEAGRSTLPGRSLFDGTAPESWSSALRLLATALPDGPAIVVLDEFPWLRESSPSLEGELQVAWDRLLERKPVLVILIGSDISMMEALTSYERPLFGRLKEIVVNPFELGDTAQMIEAEDPALAIDAQLVTGGYPRICMEWRGATDIGQFFRRQFADENCELIDVGRNVLAAEFPPDLQATRVLSAIGAGARTNKEIGTRSGMQATPLARSLDTLISSKRTVAVDIPLSIRQRRDPRYRVADPYLRFWLRFVEPSLPDIARGRPDLALDRIRAYWGDYRGLAVEPLVRACVERLAAADTELVDVSVVGGYWTRSNDVEVDLVGVDRWPGASHISAVGSIKWREKQPFDRHDFTELARAAAQVPGASEPKLIAVSRTPCVTEGLDRVYGPADLVASWTRR
jgi:AAA+ ATPase superfamily predicted ATPase